YFNQCNLDNASVREADLRGASFRETSLRNANLEKVIVEMETSFMDTDFTEAIIWVGNIRSRGRAVRVILPNGDTYTTPGMEIGY
ncbi:MAG: pentapeptide repeat-containing protein, partial [Oculatellaceae cyanobacterium Prado106]|nr:pentapeptide repeat-containing protein [Oculatellaceae cyanobacterium Prado106]